MTDAITRTGSCLCGAITYRVTGPVRPVVACHCTQCRKATGHHVAATSVPRDQIEVQGPVTWYQSSDFARRGFCPTCGSHLFWDGPGANLAIMVGTMDSPTGLTLTGHIYTDDKGDYYDIADGLPCSGGEDPDLTTTVIP